jgi:hypothetical protein
MFGGNTLGALLAETWELDATGWQRKADGPSAQFNAVMAYDPLAKRVVLVDQSGDTYAYTGTWMKLPVARLSSARNGASITFDPWRRRLVLFGGYDASFAMHDDVWALGDSAWEPVAVSGAGPSPRYRGALVAQRESHALVLFGGSDLATDPGDTWLLASTSATPDEICDDGMDNDDDRRVDAEDPDCTLP